MPVSPDVPALAAVRPARERPLEIERSVVEAAQRGEPLACRSILRRHQTAVGSVLRRLLGPAGLDGAVEDLAQETFLRAFAALPQFDPDGPGRLSTWLLTIATRLALNELQRRRPALATAGEDELPSKSRADEGHRRRTLAAAIEQAVADLTHDQRAVFVLREYHGLDYAEIADSLQVDLGTVKSRLGRARAALRKALAEVHDG